MNDLSYLETDFEGNIQNNFSQSFSENGSQNFPALQINTTKMTVFSESLYLIGNYEYGNIDNNGYEYESAKSYLCIINSDNLKIIYLIIHQ